MSLLIISFLRFVSILVLVLSLIYLVTYPLQYVFMVLGLEKLALFMINIREKLTKPLKRI